jgi:hypothetical protein
VSRRFEVVVTFWLNAEDEGEAQLVIENLISPDQDTIQETDLDWVLSPALEE